MLTQLDIMLTSVQKMNGGNARACSTHTQVSFTF